MIVVGYDKEMYDFGCVPSGVARLWLISMRSGLVLGSFDMEMRGFCRARRGNV